MSTTTPTVVIGARIAPEYREQLAAMAERNASTVSRIVGRIIAERLDSEADAA